MIDISGFSAQNSPPSHSSVAGIKLTTSSAQSNPQEKTFLPTDKTVQSVPVTELKPSLHTNASHVDIFVVSDNVFSLYKLPDGKVVSTIRNLRTGEEQTIPSLDTLTFFEAMRGQRGVFIEKDV